MKKFLIAVLTIFFFSAVLEQFLPWWSIAVVAFLTGYAIQQKAFTSFVSGFLSVFLLWTLYAYLLSSVNENILAKKVAVLLPLHGNVLALFLITGLIGGLVSGLASLSGNFAAKIRV